MRGEPKYFKFHRVFSTKKYVNGTVLRNAWSEKANDFIYEVVTDRGEKIWATHWTLTSENPIQWFIGQKAYSLTHQQNCKVIDIVGTHYYDWLLDVVLESGEKIRIKQSNLSYWRNPKLHT